MAWKNDQGGWTFTAEIGPVDFTLLRRQWEWLLVQSLTDEAGGAFAAGLIGLIENVCDAAARAGVPEDVVYECPPEDQENTA